MSSQRPGRAIFAEPLAAKVPEITLLFWVVKILTTCGGEAVSDYLALGDRFVGAVVEGARVGHGLVEEQAIEVRRDVVMVAGVRGGKVVGASDRIAAYPSTTPYSPCDVAATMFAALGVDPAGNYEDLASRPYAISPGRPIGELYRG